MPDIARTDTILPESPSRVDFYRSVTHHSVYSFVSVPVILLKLSPCRKLYSRETQRAAPPEETLRRAEGKLPAAGITRIADITQLDRVGIPVFSCIRPTAEMGAVSVYNGKGATPLAARVSAMMEGIERYSGEVWDREIHYAKYEELRETAAVLDPRRLILPNSADPSGILPWVEGFDLMRDESLMVPAQAVFHPLSSPSPPGTPRKKRSFMPLPR
jgi:ribosomal protein S12 methylthiotransferase accessory factor YcaO